MTIYVVTHEKVQPCLPDGYRLISVGGAAADAPPGASDSSGDNISEKNACYCELTAAYWIWKNGTSDIVGLMHYRRFLTTHPFSRKAYISENEVKKLLEGYDFPDIETDYVLREELKKRDRDSLYEELTHLDPASAQTIERNDKKKIIRALEIMRALGKPLSEIRGVKEHPYEVEWIGLNFPRNELYERIHKRVDIMLEQGLIEETKELLSKYGRIQNLLHTIGYQEIIAYLDGIMSLEEAVEKLKQNTRNYAKRQLTWFRKNEQIKWNCYPEKLKK